MGKPYVYSQNLVWDINTLAFVKMTQPTSGGDGAGGDVNVTNTSLAVTGPLTDTELRAADIKVTLDGEVVPVTGTFYQATQPVSGPLTDAQLRAADVKITLDSEVVPVTGPLTDTELRATAVPITNGSTLTWTGIAWGT